MPGGDQTGPMGNGPMTGRGMGWCAGFGMPGYANAGPGGGRGRGWGGFGRGRGFRGGRGGGWGFPSWGAAWLPFGGAEPSASDERGFLETQVKALEGQLGEIRKRLGEIEGESKGKK